MANQEHLEILKQGAQVWNQWRETDAGSSVDLFGADLSYINLRGVNFMEVDLREADLREVDANRTNFAFANLSKANLIKAKLLNADFDSANLSEADLSETNLSYASFDFANLTGANLRQAILRRARFYVTLLSDVTLDEATFVATILADVDLQKVHGLVSVKHRGPSIIDTRTLFRSQGKIPKAFLREAGTAEALIENLQFLVTAPIQYSTCFISYSSKDDAFARSLHASLQQQGVRCWFAPEDMKIGDEIRVRIDESIRLYDKLLVVLSENSVNSAWVEDEVEAALEKERLARERGEKQTVLFPIQLDDAMKGVTAGWPAKIRRTRNIGDFRNWDKSHADYMKAFKRLLHDLEAEG